MSKLPKLCSNPEFEFPSLKVAEMATSEAVASIHAAMVEPGSKVLDMTAGLGVDAFAFAANNCSVTAIELDTHTAEALKKNVVTLGLQNLIDVVGADSTVWLENNSATFDVIFIDPARRDECGRHFLLKDCHPDVISLMPLLLSRASKVIVKASPMLNCDALDDFGADVYIVGTTTECKELVFTLPSSGSNMVKCITVGHGEFTVTGSSDIPLGLPSEGQILLQPYPTVMKAGGNVDIDGVRKLNAFSHLYFSETHVSYFPGEAYEILDIIPFNKRNAKSLKAKYPEINVAVRNFPLRAPELASMLKIKEGGSLMLFGTTGPDNEKLLIVCQKLKPQTI
ncbi:MAG: class I SAM-dependent methyltransferase [Muribaculaceae bacterium]|nr:class I SAM-dependent methyltransferase [Muribaculaceae bacterium]